MTIFVAWLDGVECSARVALAILWLAASYLLLLGVLILARPSRARRFLSGFAQTTAANLTEAALRGLVGVAFVLASGETKMPFASLAIGLFLALSAVLLVLLPGAHRRFARRSTEAVFGFFPLLGVCSIVLACALAWFLA